DSWGKPGYTLDEQSSQKVIVNYSVENFFLSQMEIEGQNFINVELPGHFLPNDEGAPNLPGSGRYIAIPQGAKATYNVISYRTETFSGVEIAPAPRIPLDTENGPLQYQKNEKIYSKNRFYPEQPVKISQDIIRGVDVVMLGITPFHYNPVTRELIVYRDLKIEVTFEGGNGHFGEDRLRSRWWDPMLNDMLLNYESLPKIDYSKSFQNTDETGCEYLIVTPNGAEFQAWADSIRKFRTLQGIRTDVMTLGDIGGSTATFLETFFNNAYNNWDIPPAAVLLLADYGSDVNSTITSPIYNNYCVSDNIFADVTGNHMPDIVFARITANNNSQLHVMVTKFLDYERTPPTNPGFYANPITALGWQTERWFQICSETVGGFWKHVQGKTPVRINAIYSGTPGTIWSSNQNTAMVVNYFGPAGQGYIPATPAELGGWTGGTASMVNTAINNGAFALQHRDHGGETGWGEPAYNSSSINGCQNTDLVFVFSINCLTGKYNMSGECFTEKFHRYTYNGQNSGALGLIAASEVSYSFVNDAYVWGMMDNMWPDFMPTYGTTPGSRDVRPAFGNAAGKYFLQQSNWPYNTSNKEVTYHLFHHHGDAFMMVYSEVPQNLTVLHNPILYAGVTSFDVTADIDSFIALTVNGEIIGTAEGTGAPVTIAIPGQTPPDQVLVTVTKQNYYRYTALVDVIPPTGPYVVRKSYTINDVTGGNGNGLMDYGETNLLSIMMENVGVQPANNVSVTISTTDTYITITDNNAVYGNIAAGATANVPDGFAFNVADDLPDGHNVIIEVTATSGTSSWVSYISIPGHAPVLEYKDYSISDPSGNNNGKLDPGETANITVTVQNTGSSEAFNGVGELFINDTYVTVNTSQANFGDIAAGGTATGTFSVTAAPNTPAGHMADFSFEIQADMGITASGTFSVVVGQIPVLVLDLDDNFSSGPTMKSKIEDLGVGVEYVTSFPADLNLYSSVFVCLGIYSNNHVLTSAEGQILVNYLNSGGCLYMEGGDTWYYDTQTPVHAMFNINATGDGTSDMGTVNGQTGTFTEGMSFTYTGENSYMDHIDPISPAFKILQNQAPAYGTGIAYDQGSYKTIGTSHEFAGLADGSSPSTKLELMEQYLIFFGVIPDGVVANFTSNTVNACEGDQVNYYDASNGNIISWNWTFEGGTPATSAMQNPVVTYNTAGTYDVSLTVSDGVESNTIEMTDYMTVGAPPATAGTPTGPSGLCIDPLNTTYNTTGATGATSYSWILDPAGAGTITGTGTNATVNWDNAFTGTVAVKVAGVNACGPGNYSAALTVTINPLPTVTLEPFDDVCVDDPAFELSGGLPAGGQYSGTGVSNGYFDPALAGLGTHTITYTYSDPIGCENFAEETILVDECTGIGENMANTPVLIFPNPNDGAFTLQLNIEDVADLRIYNSLNETIFLDTDLEITKGYTRDINLGIHAKGVYYLMITGNHTQIIKKIIIQK
ncbi:MAG: PKD domain-containing protein, partial [Bacteroidales bacterium]|nr:PKD domain-containing protein [Bacteroidales bacterium]